MDDLGPEFRTLLLRDRAPVRALDHRRFQDTVEDMLPKTIEELEELQSVDNSLPGMSGALPVLED